MVASAGIPEDPDEECVCGVRPCDRSGRAGVRAVAEAPDAGIPRLPDGKPNLADVIERFRRPSLGQLELQITIDDPKAYTKPWTVLEKPRLLVNTELLEFVCLENERDQAHMMGK